MINMLHEQEQTRKPSNDYESLLLLNKELESQYENLNKQFIDIA